MARVMMPCLYRVLTAATLGLCVLGLAAAGPAKAAVEKAVIALPAPVVLFLSVYVAEDYFWPKAGLDVKVIYIPGVGSMNAVIAGSAEFSLSSGGSLTRAAAHGQRLLAIANLNNRSGQFIAIRKDIAEARHFDPKASFAVRVRSLKGLTIATGGLGSVADAVIRIALKSAGLDSEKRRSRARRSTGSRWARPSRNRSSMTEPESSSSMASRAIRPASSRWHPHCW
jgi:ABC-type nitrate/sulfonate/bicarbonate transport system substrate-binding protein